jgi:hypothetical protein
MTIMKYYSAGGFTAAWLKSPADHQEVYVYGCHIDEVLNAVEEVPPLAYFKGTLEGYKEAIAFVDKKAGQ